MIDFGGVPLQRGTPFFYVCTHTHNMKQMKMQVLLENDVFTEYQFTISGLFIVSVDEVRREERDRSWEPVLDTINEELSLFTRTDVRELMDWCEWYNMKHPYKKQLKTRLYDCNVG